VFRVMVAGRATIASMARTIHGPRRELRAGRELGSGSDIEAALLRFGGFYSFSDGAGDGLMSPGAPARAGPDGRPHVPC